MPRRRLTPAAAAACAAALLLPAAADASQVTRDGGTLTLQAAPGESNRVAIDQDFFSSGKLSIRDQAGISSFPPECTEETAGTITCAPAGITTLVFELGDGEDHFDASVAAPAGLQVGVNGGPGNDDLSGGNYGLGMALNGGEGDDVLHGSEGNDVLDGGSGNDKLSDRVGSDTLRGGEGNDELDGDAVTVRGADVIDGGPGVDTLKDTYSGHARIDLSFDGVANDGGPGEGDNVVGVETYRSYVVTRFVAGAEPVTLEVMQSGPGGSELSGSPGADRLRTYDYADTIRGGAGNDDIEAGNGDDTVDPGPGQDTVNTEAGPGSCNFIQCRGSYGNDTVNARDGEKDSIECGLGTDTVVADAIDVVAQSCENVDRGTPVPPANPGSQTPRGGGKATGARCVVPKVARGARLAATRTKLTKAKCKVTTVRVRSKKVRKGRVVALKLKKGKKLRAVKAGTRLANGTTIVVQISRGRR